MTQKNSVFPYRAPNVKPPERPTKSIKKEKNSNQQLKKEISSSNLSYLKPKSTIQVNGKLSYKESLRAWNIIHLQQEILDLFPALRQRRESFGYTMFYSRESKEAKKILEELEKQGVVPIMLLLGKVKQ